MNYKKLILLIIILLVGLFFLSNKMFLYQLTNQESLKIYDRYGAILYDVRDEYRQTNYQELSTAPQQLQDILISLEDQRFYKHHGVDIQAIIRAIYLKIKNKTTTIQGASTIDQQVIKLSLQAFANRDIRQKIKENIVAINLNFHYSKEEILLYYINNIYFPNGVKGYQTACQAYFNKPCNELSQGQLIYLYAKAKFPNKIPDSKYLVKIAESAGIDNYNTGDFIEIKQQSQFQITSKAKHFVNYSIAEATQDKLENADIYTQFDTELYNKIQGILDNYQNYLSENEAKEVCVVVLENGTIASMNVFSQSHSQINGCLRPRQVGSSIKPFLYLLAFKQLNYDAETKIIDEAVSFDSEYGNYTPQNFDLQYHGEVTLAQALGSSLNIPAVKLLNQIGLTKYYNFLQEIGKLVNTKEQRQDDASHFGLSLALGSKEISPLDFARMREIFNPNFCEKTTETSHQNFCSSYQIEIAEVRKILSQNHNRLISFGQYNWFDLAGTYGKSGTSRHFVDGRICGGTTGLSSKTVCIRAGNYTNQPTRASGHDLVGPLWYEIVHMLK